jgi:hypothetical protein
MPWMNDDGMPKPRVVLCNLGLRVSYIGGTWLAYCCRFSSVYRKSPPVRSQLNCRVSMATQVDPPLASPGSEHSTPRPDTGHTDDVPLRLRTPTPGSLTAAEAGTITGANHASPFDVPPLDVGASSSSFLLPRLVTTICRKSSIVRKFTILQSWRVFANV